MLRVPGLARVRVLIAVAAPLLLATLPAAPCQAQVQLVSTVPNLQAQSVAELTYGLLPVLGARARLDGVPRSGAEAAVAGRAPVQPRFGASLLTADLYSLGGGFRISGGLVLSDHRLDPIGRHAGRSVHPSRATLGASAVSLGSGKQDLDRTVPYLGLGWGSARADSGGVFFSAEVGAVFSVPIALSPGFCGPALPVSACSLTPADPRADEARLRNAVADDRVDPLLMLGVGLRF